ncbi:hypothetical protein PoB_001037700 [Plakobranchus ocellatus]|uniref:Uncharacterized protein n=1 Tax=Plakobranchus ocellatus TaxID=259542 RepID=A0AAV3YP11_9GAST|nr:hypothetical protein PoB_001037700 [Plakobranchus ocellatus]
MQDLSHIAQDCTYSSPSAKKEVAEIIATAPRGGPREDSKASTGPAQEVTDNLQSEIKGWNASAGQRQSCTGCDELHRVGKSREDEEFRMSILRGEIGGREIDMMREIGCEAFVVHRTLVEESQLTGENCLMIRIDNTALLAEKVVVNLRTSYLSDEIKALCIPDAVCDVIVGNVEGARGPEDPDMSVM